MNNVIYNEETLHLVQLCENLSETICESLTFQQYENARNEMTLDNSALTAKATFQKAKESYEELSRFGEYVPGIKEQRKALYQKKRQLDLCESVANFRQAETQLQELLDSICQQVAYSFSEDVKVDYGNPFFETTKSNCGGNCHAS
ncbi:YlbF family regulator [Enterococcus canintestini]|uniref:YlbF family regulator n=1 Tax=Enterococcus canintestini TaxID=317010 RepID=UPI0039928D0A